MVTWASNKKELDVCLHYADVVSFNDYPGWYHEPGNVSDPVHYPLHRDISPEDSNISPPGHRVEKKCRLGFAQTQLQTHDRVRNWRWWDLRMGQFFFSRGRPVLVPGARALSIFAPHPPSSITITSPQKYQSSLVAADVRYSNQHPSELYHRSLWDSNRLPHRRNSKHVHHQLVFFD